MKGEFWLFLAIAIKVEIYQYSRP